MNRKIFDELKAVYNLPETQEKSNAVIDKLNSIKIARSELKAKLDREKHSVLQKK